jgi:hypothetical protein
MSKLNKLFRKLKILFVNILINMKKSVLLKTFFWKIKKLNLNNVRYTKLNKYYFDF